MDAELTVAEQNATFVPGGQGTGKIMLRRLLLGAGAASFMSVAAYAADVVEPTAAFDWTGPYIGLQAGYGWNRPSVDLDPSPGLADAIDSGNVDESADDFERNGFIGGAFAGYLLQRDSLVFGLEGDIEYSDMDGSTKAVQQIINNPTMTIGKLDNDIDWLASLRLRGGFAIDRALFYATGGLAVGGTELDFSGAGSAVTNDSDHDTKFGWTVGGGVEYAISDNLSLRAEYRYTDLGKLKVRTTTVNNTVFYEDFEVDQTFHAVRGGLSWHF